MRPALVLASLLTASFPAQPGLAPPQEALGHEVGADGFLASYAQLVAYWRQLDAASDRMQLREIGTTGYGQTMVMAVVSSPANLGDAERLRGISVALGRGRDADGRPLTEAAIGELAEQGRAVVWIDGGLHATEAIAGQNVLELVWRMVSRDDAETRRILDEVVLLVCPVNPDGMEMVAQAYAATGKVGNLPVLYQRYCGHDNNRDHYAVNTAESVAVTRVFYHEWLPQIVYNHHQSAPRGTVIYTPPFRDPHHYYVDPLVVRGIEFVAANMNARFAWEDKPGVISRSGAPYSMWWNGGLRTTTCFHNMIGILTEVFGNPDPTELVQGPDRRLASGDYPMPVSTRTWHARDTIEYLQTANFAVLDTAARYRAQVLANFGRMAVRSIERGSRDHWTPTPKLLARAQRDRAPADAGDTPSGDGDEPARPSPERRGPLAAVDALFRDPSLRDPRAYVLPAEQPDRGALRRFLTSLRRTGVEVRQAGAPFSVSKVRRFGAAPDSEGEARYPAGTFVVRCDQAFRPHVLDMFEPQWHPDDIGKDGQPIRPYDSAGWTLAMQMGVQFDRVLEGLEADFPLVDEVTLPPPVRRKGALFSPENSDAYLAVNRMLRADVGVNRLGGGEDAPASGAFQAKAGDGAAVAQRILDELCIPREGGELHNVTPLRAARIGVYEPWGSTMEIGWVEWVLEQYEFAYERVYGDVVEAGGLRERFDVLILASGLPAASARGDARSRPGGSEAAPGAATREQAEKVLAAMPPFEVWQGQLERVVRVSREHGVPNLRAFVEGGGTLLVFAGQAQRAAKHFELPVEVGLYRDVDGERRAVPSRDFFIPGSLVALDVHDTSVLASGVPARVAAMFRRSEAFTVAPDAGSSCRVVATWGERAELLSGWALGLEHLNDKAAVVECRKGAGRVVLYGPDVVYRGQPHASFKLFFNALYVEK